MTQRRASRATPDRPLTRSALEEEVDRLVAGEHPDPHHLLGRHGDQLRVWRPDATRVWVVDSDNKRTELHPAHPGGLFVARLGGDAGAPTTAGDAGAPTTAGDAATVGTAYRLAVEYPDGTSIDLDDPYRFWPTVGELDLHLFAEGTHRRLWEVMGASARTHQGTQGTSFAVWAPNARSVRVVGDFNLWDGRVHPMRSMGASGVWEIFIPDAGPGSRYKYEILTSDGRLLLKADPYALSAELPPGTASLVAVPDRHLWSDAEWLSRRGRKDHQREAMSVYELHLGSWKRRPEEAARSLSYDELAAELPEYVAAMGFTHVELMPVAEHPFGGSWGYQVSSYYAPTARHGSPEGMRRLVDALHKAGIGVILDWVPAHFPRDDWALARFDGTALYEHQDPRRGAQPDWGTLVFNLGRNEVRNFLISNALYWLESFHIDGLRVDAVASMLYLDYSRGEGQWVPNEHGGRENLEAVGFLRELNHAVGEEHAGAMTVAEESTAWPGVSRPAAEGGLGFSFKWNMGWMHDTLDYFAKDPLFRSHHQDRLTFGLLYAFSESFVLPLSHDEVVHGKGSLLAKMPGDRWQQLANLRALLAWMWAHPGKQLVFMGTEIAQEREWTHDASLDWHLLEESGHRGVQDLVRAINRAYLAEPSLWTADFTHEGFRWIDASDSEANVLSFLRLGGGRPIACVANLSPVVREDYRVGLPTRGPWTELVNTDAVEFGGSGVGNGGEVWAKEPGWHGLAFAADVTLPPLGVLWLAPAPAPAEG